MPSSASLRRRLVDELAIADPQVRDAFLRIPRERFVPDFARREGLEAVYHDEVVVTKVDAQGISISSSSQPRIMAAMLERLALAPALRVLEIGAGSGYNAALLKTIVGPEGRIVSVDVDPELARSARRALREGGHSVRVVCGDGRDGYAAAAPYDRIVATVSTSEVPRAWRDQLVDGGLLELPLALERGEQIVATFRRDGERLRSVGAVVGGFMPLRGTSRPQVPALLASGSYLDGAHTPLLELHGPGVAALSTSARRRLLALALGRPRHVALPDPLPRWELRLHLALELPDARLVESPGLGIGAAGRAGRSLALADTSWPARDPARARHLLTWGDGDAEPYLLRAVERWRARGCPGPDELDLRVEFDGDQSVLTRTWRRS